MHLEIERERENLRRIKLKIMENEIKQNSVAYFIANLLSNLEGKGLTSLEGSLKEVDVFNVSNNNLRNLIGGPKIVEKYIADLNQLESLEGAPEEVEYFDVRNNRLKNLIGGPKIVIKYYAAFNQLESLEGSPEKVDVFNVSYNQLKNLIGGPKIVIIYYATFNQLESLAGAPEKVDIFNISYNQLKNLIGGPKIVKEYTAYSNKLESLEGAPEKVDVFNVSYNPTLKNTEGIPKRIGILDLRGTIRSSSQFTEYPEYVGDIYFDNEIPIEDVKEIVSNIKEVGLIYIGDEGYIKDDILEMNKNTK